MSTPGNGQQQATSAMPCPNCQQPMAVNPPIIRIQNFPELSIVLFSHAKLEKCPQCGSTFAIAIAGFNQQGGLEFALKEIKTQQSAIIAPSAQETLQVNKEKLPS